MKYLSLFAGIGGFDLGLERAGMKCVGQVEFNPFCQRVLAHHWPNVKRMGDIHDVTGTEFGAVDLVCGGVPCQPASQAGKRRGTQDDRWLWPEAFRIVRVIRPTWCLFENVRGLTSLESGVVFENLLSEPEEIGYEVQASLFQLAPSMPRTKEKEFGLLPGGKNRMWMTPKAGDGDFCTPRTSGRPIEKSTHLATQVKLYPTPTVQDSENDGGPSQYNRNSIPLNALVKLLPTPSTMDTIERKAMRPSRAATNRTTGYLSETIPGSLNPTWVEWLMGFPVGWTACGVSEMPSCRKSSKL